MVPESTANKLTELKLAAFIAEHTSIRCVDHLGELLKVLDTEHFNIKLHRTKCTGIITEVLAPELKKEMIEDIGDSSFSLILDESNDCTNIKCLGAVIRYWSLRKRKIINTLYCLVSLDDCDANGIMLKLLDSIEADGLNIKNLCGIGIDGANVMVGQSHSVYTLLRDVAGDHLVLNRCICHSLHLAASKASEILPRNLDFMIKETCYWFSCSHKRRREFNELYKTINEGVTPLKLSNLSLTRWLARRDVIGKILQQWDALCLHFNLGKQNERCYTANLLHQMYSDLTNKMYLTYVFYILDDVCRVNAIFQAQNPNSLLMFEELADLYFGFLKKIVVPVQLVNINRENVMDFDFEKFVMHTSGMYFGYQFEMLAGTLSKSSSNNVNEIKERCKMFLIEVIKQIKLRLPNNLGLLIKLKNLSPSQAVNPTNCEQSILPLVIEFKHFIKDVDRCLSEWKMLSTEPILISFVTESPTNIIDFWFRVYGLQNSYNEPKYPNISKFALTLLTIPLSNASIERIFSQMNIVKNKIRNKLLVSTTESILLVRNCLQNVRMETCVNFIPSKKMLALFRSNNIYNNHDANNSVQVTNNIEDDELEFFDDED